MSEELISVVNERHPAIAPEKLILPSGEFANKYTLLKFAYEAGLPVPKIIPETELQQYWRQAKGDSLYQRGYFQDSVDNWTVDTLPTTELLSPPDDIIISHPGKTTEATKQYLARNFGLVEPPRVSSFLQESVPGDNFYLSTWSFGNQVFGMERRGHQATNHSYFNKKQQGLVDWSKGMGRENVSFVEEELYPLEAQVKLIFDQALKGKFDYKIDYLLCGGDLNIIQIRVASAEVDDQFKIDKLKAMRKLVANGTPLIASEIGQLEGLPKSPHILKLTNKWHFRAFDSKTKLDLDMTGMQGLLLPYGLKGGLLEHGGGIFIAYALYWGLPIVINSESGDLITK